MSIHKKSCEFMFLIISFGEYDLDLVKTIDWGLRFMIKQLS